jgi:hypothetical protein
MFSLRLEIGLEMKKGLQPQKLKTLDIIGTPGPIRTGGLRIRSPTLYPAELRARPEKQDKG